jgi:transposase
VTIATESLPDDPGMLKAMLLAERAESERLRQIISEFQRYRFGRRAESLPEEQLQLALEEAEQVEAAGEAESEAKTPAVGKAALPNAEQTVAHSRKYPAENKRLDAFVKIIANHRFHC